MAKKMRDDYANRAHKGAYRKGYAVGLKGGRETENPYRRESPSGRGCTWLRGYYYAWRDGFRDGRASD